MFGIFEINLEMHDILRKLPLTRPFCKTLPVTLTALLRTEAFLSYSKLKDNKMKITTYFNPNRTLSIKSTCFSSWRGVENINFEINSKTASLTLMEGSDAFTKILDFKSI